MIPERNFFERFLRDRRVATEDRDTVAIDNLKVLAVKRAKYLCLKVKDTFYKCLINEKEDQKK